MQRVGSASVIRRGVGFLYSLLPASEEHRVDLVGPDGENPLLAVDRACYEPGPGQ
jgi:hypothetical protein